MKKGIGRFDFWVGLSGLILTSSGARCLYAAIVEKTGLSIGGRYYVTPSENPDVGSMWVEGPRLMGLGAAFLVFGVWLIIWSFRTPVGSESNQRK